MWQNRIEALIYQVVTMFFLYILRTVYRSCEKLCIITFVFFFLKNHLFKKNKIQT